MYQFIIENEQVVEPDPEFDTPKSIYNLDTKLNDIPIKEGQTFEYKGIIKYFCVFIKFSKIPTSPTHKGGKGLRPLQICIDFRKFYVRTFYLSLIYDFGDFWKHKLTVEKVYKYTLQDIGRDVMNGGHKVFPYCTDGAKKCPPEDVGSIEGYFKFVESMNTKNEDYEENLEWYGSHYDENEFNIKKINKRLTKEL